MSYHIIWKNPDSSIKVTNMHEVATLEATVEHKNILIAQGELASFQVIIRTEQLPQERYFRNAWRFDGNNVILDTATCRQRHLDKLRRIRNSKLQDSDADYVRALEQDDQTKLAALKTYRQALRDMPQISAIEFQTAATSEAIRNIQPAILTAPKP